MDPDVKRNLVKVGIFAGLAWIGYSIVKGVSKNESVESIVKESVAPVAAVTEGASKVVKKATRFLKGSPEAKKFMDDLRAKRKSKLTDSKVDELIKDEKKGAAEYEKVGLPNIAKDEKKHEKILEKIEAKKEKRKYVKSGKHKGHKTKRGLAQDQRLVSKEEHEVAYQNKKKIPI